MAIFSTPVTVTNNTPFLIVTQDDPSIPVGTVLYFQNGAFGVGKGLLLSLTNTANFFKVLKTNNGLVKVT